MATSLVEAERKEIIAILQYQRGVRSEIVRLGSLGSVLEKKNTLGNLERVSEPF